MFAKAKKGTKKRVPLKEKEGKYGKLVLKRP
jgi:hypothetical protein